MRVVGDLVGDVGDLGFHRGEFPGLEFLLVEAVRGVVLRDALARLPGQVETLEGRIAPFEQVDDAQALPVVLEPSAVLHQAVEGILAAVAEGRMAQVVGEGDGGRQVLVGAEVPRDRFGNARRLHGVGEARPVVIALVVHEDLGLVLEPAE